MRMVEAVIEVMDCLNSMGNYFSYTSLMGLVDKSTFLSFSCAKLLFDFLSPFPLTEAFEEQQEMSGRREKG